MDRRAPGRRELTDRTAGAGRGDQPAGRRPWAEPADPSQPRLFVAVPLPEEARRAIATLVTDVAGELDAAHVGARSAVRWVRLEGLHVTLRFLGPTDPARVADVVGAMTRAADGVPSFRVVLGGGGAFPSVARPRALWVGIRSGADHLAAIAGRLEEELVGAGWPPVDRPFRAHLTLARSDGRREGPDAARRLARRAEELEIVADIDRVRLFESITGGGPARYEALAETPLRRLEDRRQ